MIFIAACHTFAPDPHLCYSPTLLPIFIEIEPELVGMMNYYTIVYVDFEINIIVSHCENSPIQIYRKFKKKL